MKNIRIIQTSFLLLILVSCETNQTNTIKNSTTGFCSNELELFISQDSIIHTDLDLFNIGKFTEKKLEIIFNEPYCKNLKFNILYNKDSLTSIPMTLNMIYIKDCNFPNVLNRPFCNILINKDGQITIDAKLQNIDSLNQKIFDFYKVDTKNNNNLNDYKHIFISILWDRKLKEQNFIKVVNEILKGYIDFSTTISKSKFQKSICDLTSEELKILKEFIPFNLRTDSYRIFELTDSLPSELLEIDEDFDFEIN